MNSSFHFPQPKRHVHGASMTMDEPTTDNSDTTHLTQSVVASSMRSKPPQPPLCIPPGHVAFRIVCHASRVGGLIGKSGSVIKRLQLLTNSKIRVEDPKSLSEHRVITVMSLPLATNRITLHDTVSNQERGKSIGGGGMVNGDERLEVSAAQEGVVRVFERVMMVATEVDSVSVAGLTQGMVSCSLLVCKNQVGAVIGKDGKVVEKIRDDSGCRIRFLKPEKFPSIALPTDAIVDIEGDALAVKKALVAVTSRLQEFPPPERTTMHGARPFEVESLSIPTEGSMTSQQEVIFKILCPKYIVGAVVGEGGSVFRALESESGASIHVGPISAESDECLITISAIENVDTQYSPAQKATILVFNRCVECVKGWDLDSKGSSVSFRLLVPSNQVFCLLGKGGEIISEIRKVTGTGIQILGCNQVLKCALENDEVFQINGEFANVQNALREVTARLRDSIFSVKLSIGSGISENNSYSRVRDPLLLELCPSFGTPDNLNELKPLSQSIDHSTFYNTDRPLSPSLSATLMISGENLGRSKETNRKLHSIQGDVELGRGREYESVETVEIAVPANAVGSVYGKNGSNLKRLRQISGAKIVVFEPCPGATDIIVSISGTTDEILSAQSLLQAFILPGSI